ncbi:hypothetical protein WJX73_007918 [Symbiochloris irregularis]|uniref:Long-chain-alcohol oxidase n=1 Tax=Symbiochloris irregularis TaxID=706552 RepID=A0AAW1NFV9_9CHLO
MVLETAEKSLPWNHRVSLLLLLTLLEWRLGTLMLAGTHALTSVFPYLHAFPQLPLRSREAILQRWSQSSIFDLRKGFRAIKALIAYNLFSRAKDLNAPELWEAMSYSGSDPPLPKQGEQGRGTSQEEQQILGATVALKQRRSLAELRDALVEKGLDVRLRGQTGRNADLEVRCDAVVVGSGAGGGVTACILASAGLKVIVLEKGDYVTAADMTWTEAEACGNMYERSGLMVTHTGGLAVLAGSTLGGGTRINWTASLRTPPHVLQEWAEDFGLPAFASAEYAAAMDAVCSRLGVRAGAKHHNLAGEALASGLSKLGLDSIEMPRNCARDDCGWCGLGCARQAKQDTATTWLVDAAAKGAVILTGAFAQSIRTQPASPSAHGQQCTAQGVVVQYSADAVQHKLHIRASCVVAAAGALHTPALLLRSKITCKGNVGKNLRLHPATCVVGIMPSQANGRQLDMYSGPLMSVYSREAAKWGFGNYGPLLSTPSGHPGLVAAVTPWIDGSSWKFRLAAKFTSTAPLLVYVRDKDCGRVKIDGNGMPQLHYWPSRHDRQSMLEGMELAARVLQAAGAHSIYLWQESQHCMWTADPDSCPGDPDFDDFIANMHRTGIRENSTTLASAHQMGSCAMGPDPGTSVTDPSGECWDVGGLYITDGSVLPTSTGVNPMITIESTAYMLATGIAKRLQPGDQASGPMQLKYDQS